LSIASDFGLVDDAWGGEMAKIDKPTPCNSALMIVDITNFDAHPEFGMGRITSMRKLDLTYYWERLNNKVLPATQRLLEAFRSCESRVVDVRVGAQFKDFADCHRPFRELHRKSGALRGTETFHVRKELAPRVGEAVIDKSGASAFTTGNADIILRNAGIKNLYLCGVMTNGCVLATSFSAWDLGYRVSVIEDACAARSESLHRDATRLMSAIGIDVVTTTQISGEAAE